MAPRDPTSEHQEFGSSDWLTAEEASRLLGIRPATLYAYVSRGRLESHSGPGRRRRYRRQDVERMRLSSDAHRSPVSAAQGALRWGSPVLDSSLTLIDRGRLYYRGADVAQLARESSLEDVAALLWGQGSPDSLFDRSLAPAPPADLSDVGRWQSAHPGQLLQRAVVSAAVDDPTSVSHRPERVARHGANLVHRLVAVAAPVCRRTAGPVDRVLQRAWLPEQEQMRPVIGAGLVLCADHELNVSSFTVRCIASAGSSLHDAVVGGLAALRGHRHGGHSDRCEALFRETGMPPVRWPGQRRRRDVPSRAEIERSLAARLQRGEKIPAFGPHPLYPGGDPRCVVLLELLREAVDDSQWWRWLDDFVDTGRDLLGEEPTIDLGLAVLASVLGLPPGGAWTLFALGRCVGWVAHYLEEIEARRLIRPRARYVGVPPGEPSRAGNESKVGG